MSQALGYFAYAIQLLRPLLFVVGVLAALAALLSWAVRTRRISPFSPLARFTRDRIDPMFRPMEQRVLRAGGTPSSAPWWTLAVVVVGGLIVLSVLRFILGQLVLATYALQGDGSAIARVIVSWSFGFLRIAIMARVISSWVGGSPYSKWWRWSYVSTEWFLRPLRQVLPTLGPIDISPLVAYFGLMLLENAILSVF